MIHSFKFCTLLHVTPLVSLDFLPDQTRAPPHVSWQSLWYLVPIGGAPRGGLHKVFGVQASSPRLARKLLLRAVTWTHICTAFGLHVILKSRWLRYQI